MQQWILGHLTVGEQSDLGNVADITTENLRKRAWLKILGSYIVLFAVSPDVIQGKCQTAKEVLLEEYVAVPHTLERNEGF